MSAGGQGNGFNILCRWWREITLPSLATSSSTLFHHFTLPLHPHYKFYHLLLLLFLLLLLLLLPLPVSSPHLLHPLINSSHTVPLESSTV
jgi:hypothetical protein